MKRIFAILFLCLYTTQSHAIFWAFSAIKEATMTEEEKRLEEEEEKKKKHFIGFSVGTGIMDLACPMFNPRYWKRGDIYANSFDIALALEGGWQKYTSEKIGYQVMFRGRLSYAPDFKSPIFSAPIPDNFSSALSIEFSAGIDGIFDFVKNNESSFGMILGINGGASVLMMNKGGSYHFIIDGANTYGVFSNLRTGFQVGLPTGFIDLVLELPIMPMFLPREDPYNYTLSLGYKHFF